MGGVLWPDCTGGTFEVSEHLECLARLSSSMEVNHAAE